MPATKEVLQFAGDYTLSGALIVGATGEMISVFNQIKELNIYQSIDTPYMSGNVLISDSAGVYEILPILGQERFVFALETPGAEDIVDFREYHAVIYNVEKRFSTTERQHTYLLNWTTIENYKNARTRVSYVFKGDITTIVEDILTNEDFLGTKKPLNLEQTINLRKYVAPNLKPFQAISHLREQALTIKNSPHFLFYENPAGFHFRSLDSLLGTLISTSVDWKKEYRKQVPSDPLNVGDNMKSIQHFEIIDSNNTFMNSRAGMFGSTLYFHDVFNKNIQKFEFSYLENTFADRNNTNLDSNYGSLISEKGTFDEKGMSDYPNSRIFVHPTASETSYHEGAAATPIYSYTDNNAEEWLQESHSRELLRDYFTMKLEVYGDTDLMCGDLINVNIPSNKPQGKSGGIDSADQILSGVYLVTHLKHQILPSEQMHNMVITGMKDTLLNAIEEDSVSVSEPKGKVNYIGGGMGKAIAGAKALLSNLGF